MPSIHLATPRPNNHESSARCWISILALAAAVVARGGGLSMAEDSAGGRAVKVGLERRTPWASSRVVGSPEPPLPFITERAFPKLQFKDCVDLAALPGSNRLLLVEQWGKVYSFENRDDTATADLVIDFAQAIPGCEQVYSLAFHPRFEENRYCYVCYIKKAELPDGTHVARFTVSPTNPPTIDPASEQTIITWLSGGHNGCCLKFGPDGFLYISTGDGAGPNPPDTLKTGQDVSDLLSSILRIDVDGADGAANYRIPQDNPFVATPGARGELWAYGLRNPWRMSFDRQTGDLWVGDVGWELWELLHRVEKGGNYGWAVMEGRQPAQPQWPRGPTTILPPFIDHPHTESSSITDGLTYYGARLEELRGVHIYGDYDTGKFWGFRFKDGKVLEHRELADTTHRVVGFGEDHAGEFYVLDHTAGTLHRMVPNPLRNAASSFPLTLGDSGLFTSAAKHQPAAGVIPYSINAQQWADHASVERLVAIPGEGVVQAEGEKWTFPEGTVLVKTLSLESRQGEPETRRRIETQILHFDGAAWQPYTFAWRDDQSDAVLVGAAGEERTLTISDPSAPGGVRRQTWRFASRAECQRCHNPWSGPVLAFDRAQLDKAHDYGGAHASQLATWRHIGLVKGAPETGLAPALVDPSDVSAPLEARARSYLHANCAHCHRMHAGGSVLAYMHHDLKLAEMNLVGARPAQGAFGIQQAQIVAPGDPYHSVLWYRMAKLGPGRMPHLGSTEIDRHGLSLIHDWIAGLGTAVNSADPLASKQRALHSADLALLASAADAQEQAAIARRLLATTSGALALVRHLDSGAASLTLALSVAEQASRSEDPNIRDLFERFLPADRRTARLGGAVDPRRILELAGDAQQGRKLFLESAGVTCKNCHRIGEAGKQVGPDLTTIGKKLDRSQLLESILFPSQRIDPQYVAYLAETSDGRLLSGLLVSRGDAEVVLKDAQDNLLRIPAESIERLAPQSQSLMPELLVRDMTAQQVADLVAFLDSLE